MNKYGEFKLGNEIQCNCTTLTYELALIYSFLDNGKGHYNVSFYLRIYFIYLQIVQQCKLSADVPINGARVRVFIAFLHFTFVSTHLHFLFHVSHFHISYSHYLSYIPYLSARLVLLLGSCLILM